MLFDFEIGWIGWGLIFMPNNFIMLNELNEIAVTNDSQPNELQTSYSIYIIVMTKSEHTFHEMCPIFPTFEDVNFVIRRARRMWGLIGFMSQFNSDSTPQNSVLAWEWTSIQIYLFLPSFLANLTQCIANMNWYWIQCDFVFFEWCKLCVCLVTHPDSCLREIGPHGNLLSGRHVRIPISTECMLQLLQLLRCEMRSLSALSLVFLVVFAFISHNLLFVNH